VSGIYYVEMLDVLRDAGCPVRENSTTNGWQKRARSSGGFPSVPLGVQWHHTASSTSPENDLAWQIVGCQDAPVGNLLLDRTGTYWPVAAGAANTAGKGGPLSLSRGTVPQDSANTRTFAVEAANSGVGEPWPTVQIDNYFVGSNALNALFGNEPTDVFNHNTWAPTRKIDPAISTAVQGPWVPGSSTSSGTWRQSDVTAECSARFSGSYGPGPDPEENDMTDEQAAQLDAIFQLLTVAQPAFVAPDGSGSALSPPWASLWGYQLVAANVLPALADVQARLSVLEGR
jgi:N-acetylmuramoyl-L-alanine amidase